MQRGKMSFLSLRWLWSDKTLLLLVIVLISLAASITAMVLSTKQVLLVIIAIPFIVFIFWLLAAHRYEWVVGITLTISVLIDWYQLIDIRFPIFSTSIALLACIMVLLERIVSRSLTVSYYWLLWGMLLILGIPPILWAVIVPEAIIYYLQIFFTPMLLFVLGALIGQNIVRVRLMLGIVAGIGTIIALHTIITAITGTFLLETSGISSYLSSVNDFTLASGVSRVGSFLRNPDWNGTFLAMLVFIPIGLLLTTPSRLAKLFYLGEIIAILLALLFTYSTASWLALGFGIIPLLLLSTRGMQRISFPVLLLVAVGSIFILFPHERDVFVQHLNDSSDAQLRLGAWETAIRVIMAHPLNGVGLGLTSYLQRAEPYRVPLQYISLAHPHNTYLELASLAGLPTLIVFLSLLGVSLRQAFKNYRRVDIQSRPLFGAAIAAIIAFSFNCLTINGWTLPPLANFAWLILAVIASPIQGHQDVIQLNFSRNIPQK